MEDVHVNASIMGCDLLALGQPIRDHIIQVTEVITRSKGRIIRVINQIIKRIIEGLLMIFDRIDIFLIGILDRNQGINLLAVIISTTKIIVHKNITVTTTILTIVISRTTIIPTTTILAIPVKIVPIAYTTAITTIPAPLIGKRIIKNNNNPLIKMKAVDTAFLMTNKFTG